MQGIQLVSISILLLYGQLTFSQIKVDKVSDKTKTKTEKKIEKRIENKIDKSIDKSLNKTEKGLENSVKSNNKSDQKSNNTTNSNSNNTSNKTNNTKPKQNTNDNNSLPDNSHQQQDVLTWNNYDFIPGTEIIFEDHQQGEQNGEFPCKWDLVKGVIENASLNNENVIFFRETGNFVNGIAPLLSKPSADYLPDEFTIELGCYFEKGKYSNYRIYFYDAKTQKKLPDQYIFINIWANKITFGNNIASKQYPATQFDNIDKQKALWRHIAISFNKRALKVYMDDTRLINIPNITENPTGLTVAANHANQENNQFIKNIRIAGGAVPLYEKILSDGKFIATGIKFDINKATIKAESMGTINYILNLMKQHPSLNFSVEGHTDSDGDEVSNQKLSEARAKAVMDKLISMGIGSNRLSYKGYGEIKPIYPNNTTEGKAQNRRVEFVKT